MKKQQEMSVFFLWIIAASAVVINAQTCKPSGELRGRKPPKECNKENDSQCCVQGELYPVYRCSPAVTARTKAILTLNSFQRGGDGGGPSACDGKYHSDNTPVVALSTGWYNRGRRCGDEIIIHANGRTARAKVVDECDSTMGCNAEHAYQPPCDHNIVDASKAVWENLGVAKDDWGWLEVHWTDA